jgi:hypothetical protein
MAPQILSVAVKLTVQGSKEQIIASIRNLEVLLFFALSLRPRIQLPLSAHSKILQAASSCSRFQQMDSSH